MTSIWEELDGQKEQIIGREKRENMKDDRTAGNGTNATQIQTFLIESWKINNYINKEVRHKEKKYKKLFTAKGI